MSDLDFLPYLDTLRRVPDDVILATATADLVLALPNSCLCGWFVREQVARMLDLDPDNIRAQDRLVEQATNGSRVTDSCVTLFGGTEAEWDHIFFGVCGSEAPAIERAFVERVLECVP